MAYKVLTPASISSSDALHYTWDFCCTCLWKTSWTLLGQLFISAWSSNIGFWGCVLTSSVWLDCIWHLRFLIIRFAILGCSALHYNCHFIATCLFYSADLINVLCRQGSCSHYNVWASNSAWPIMDAHRIWTGGRILWRRGLAGQPREIKVISC